ncbi:hypothetical protein FSARC_11169 [Fusarium sarcochroum]|uniref:TRP C-terminal domain-containing protein n=1 Tax=Fusarium sarcochroum TaxID=1208366 RepID=A0A8H4X0R4_9HYPO|nr:hypothetical protein FSARC_11169 [Fusarium sarcochroum]
MRPQPISWQIITFFTLILHTLPSTAVWQDNPWVRKYSCGQALQNSPARELRPFRIDSFRGWWDTQSDPTELRLDILAVHNTSLLTCQDIDVSALEASIVFQVLGHSVGQLKHFSNKCPLPITNTLTPIGDTLFSSYHLTYSFQSTHRFQTLESAFRFKGTNGAELDCGIAKITPDLGQAVSTTLTYTPFVVLILVILSSWNTHFSDRSSSYVLDHESILTGQKQLWRVVLDTTSYLRFLQFAFVSALMSMEYPGFYVPAVGKLAWASLLFWRGPFDNGHSYQGPTGDMYTSNASYGLGYMTQMLQYPNMLNTLANSLVNFIILAAPTFFLFSLLFWKTSLSTQSSSLSFFSIIKKAAGTTIAYDLILVGYLPNYRIGLAIAMMLIIVGAHHFLTQGLDDQSREKPTETGDGNMASASFALSFHWVWKTASYHLPHMIPLLQAMGIGGLQSFPTAQLFVLIACECLLLVLHLAAKNTRMFSSTTVWSSTIRLLTASLHGIFLLPVTEATRQYSGYVILAFHGFAIFSIFFIKSIWQLCQIAWRRRNHNRDDLSNGSREALGAVPILHMDNLPSSSSSNLVEYRKNYDQEASRRYLQQDPSTFYREPRSRAPTPSFQVSRSTSVLDISTAPTPESSIIDRPFDLHLALSQVSPTPDVDYSVRESDLYYGMPEERTFSGPVSPSDSSSSPDRRAPGEGRLYKKLMSGLPTTLRRSHEKEKEKGFQVRRPPRPPLFKPDTTLLTI